MKDSVDKLFKERFSGHELPVDPALWAAIEGQLLATAATTDPVNELFKERFQGHELPVEPAVWEGIGRQLGRGPAPPASTSVWTWAAGAAAVLVVGAGLWWSTSEKAAPLAEERPAAVVEVLPSVEVPDVASPASEVPADNAAVPVVAIEEPAGAQPVRASAPDVAPSATSTTNPSVQPQAVREPAVDLATAPSQRSHPEEPTSIVEPAPAPTGGTIADHAAESDPQRVEAIIQEISERTVNEARSLARTDVTAPPPQQAPEENAPEAPELFMPNTFTPNGDGVNDTYVLDMEGFAQMSVRVLSLRTDKLVFSTMSGEPWTGAGCEDGMYVVVVEAVSEDGRNLSKAKVVWLTRERMN